MKHFVALSVIILSLYLTARAVGAPIINAGPARLTLFHTSTVLMVLPVSRGWQPTPESDVIALRQKGRVERAPALKLVLHRISLANSKSFDLNLPEGFAISVAAQGLKRVRFMANSPDGRIFVTDMYNLSDNKRGVIYILDGLR